MSGQKLFGKRVQVSTQVDMFMATEVQIQATPA
jgi:hypothetical protein